MSNPWKKVNTNLVQNLSEIMSEEYAKDLQNKEEFKFAKHVYTQNSFTEPNDTSSVVLGEMNNSQIQEYCDSDALIAKVLQCQFDKEYDAEIKKIEERKNGDSKVSISYENYRCVPSSLSYESDTDDKVAIERAYKKNWDRFESNEKERANLPKKGYFMQDGKIITKHDSLICGRQNALRLMTFPPGVCTGDGAAFDMRVPNYAYNHLKEHAKQNSVRRYKVLDRKESDETTQKTFDETTRLILVKLINKGLFPNVSGIISTGKESMIVHAHCDQSYSDMILPKECAIKIYKTSSCDFKTRDKYIEADVKFNGFPKQNSRQAVLMWAEKEMHNLKKMQKIGINCPEVIALKKHLLVMSFIGRDSTPAPKLRDVILSQEKWQSVYNEVVDVIHKLYNVGHLIHADLSEYNILWWENKCWFIDVSQSVQPNYPGGLEFLLRDCRNICNFFEKKDVTNIKSAEDLFKSITGFDDIDVNMLEGVHTTYNPRSSRFEIPLFYEKNVTYPFDYCFSKTKDNQNIELHVHDKVDEKKDKFDEMWTYSQKKTFDNGSVIINDESIEEIQENSEDIIVIDKVTEFGDILRESKPKSGVDGSSSPIDKKS